MHITPDTYMRYFEDDLKIMLDGVEVRFCMEADDKIGYVVACVLDTNGNLVTDGDNIITEQREGVVKFIGTRRDL